MEDHKSLKTSAVVSKLANAVKNKVNDLLADGVVATGIVVGSILLTGDELLGVVELTVSAGTDLVNNGGLKIDHHTARDILASAGLTEEGVEGVIDVSVGLLRAAGLLAVRLNAVLKAEELPAGVTDLATGLCSGEDIKKSNVGMPASKLVRQL